MSRNNLNKTRTAPAESGTQTGGLGDPAGEQGKSLAGSEAGGPGAETPSQTEPLADSKEVPFNPIEEKRWAEIQRRVEMMNLAHRFAGAVLQNPKIDNYLYGSPLEAGPRGNAPNEPTGRSGVAPGGIVRDAACNGNRACRAGASHGVPCPASRSIWRRSGHAIRAARPRSLDLREKNCPQ